MQQYKINSVERSIYTPSTINIQDNPKPTYENIIGLSRMNLFKIHAKRENSKKMHILTSKQVGQHPFAGKNIQQTPTAYTAK